MNGPAATKGPGIGDAVASIDTPALVIDLDAMERNLAAMAEFARARNVRLRPHAKMHKCAAIAKRQIEAGAVGVCVQKLGEAEILAAAGITDIFISNEIVAPSKLERVAAPACCSTISPADGHSWFSPARLRRRRAGRPALSLLGPYPADRTPRLVRPRVLLTQQSLGCPT